MTTDLTDEELSEVIAKAEALEAEEPDLEWRTVEEFLSDGSWTPTGADYVAAVDSARILSLALEVKRRRAERGVEVRLGRWLAEHRFRLRSFVLFALSKYVNEDPRNNAVALIASLDDLGCDPAVRSYLDHFDAAIDGARQGGESGPEPMTKPDHEAAKCRMCLREKAESYSVWEDGVRKGPGNGPHTTCGSLFATGFIGGLLGQLDCAYAQRANAIARAEAAERKVEAWRPIVSLALQAINGNSRCESRMWRLVSELPPELKP